jgi:hypothetical protein
MAYLIVYVCLEVEYSTHVLHFPDVALLSLIEHINVV